MRLVSIVLLGTAAVGAALYLWGCATAPADASTREEIAEIAKTVLYYGGTWTVDGEFEPGAYDRFIVPMIHELHQAGRVDEGRFAEWQDFDLRLRKDYRTLYPLLVSMSAGNASTMRTREETREMLRRFAVEALTIAGQVALARIEQS